MTMESKERVLNAMEQAGLLYLRILNDPHWPLRHMFVNLLQRYIRRCERRLAGA